MKKEITKTQWDELDEKSKKKLYEFYLKTKLYLTRGNGRAEEFTKDFYFLFTIGQLIEFLEDDFVKVVREMWVDEKLIKDLCNLLWEATKRKINQ